MQAASLVLPLVTVPFLARTLGPAMWGQVAAAQGFAMLAGLIVEFGFNISAARMVAQQREEPVRLAGTYAAVTTAQALLLVLAVLVALTARSHVPFLVQNGGLFWAAIIWMIPQVISFQWYYQGVEQMPRLAALVLAGRIAGLAGVFAVVKSPDDAMYSLLIPGLAGLIATGWAGLLPCFHLRPSWPGPAGIRSVLGGGLALCGFRAGMALQGAANTFLLACFLSPQLVGAYAGADRLIRAAGALLEPVLVTVFPRVAYLQASGEAGDRGQAESWRRWSRLCLLAAGGAIAVMFWVLAPWLPAWVLGPGYEEATPILRVLALSPLAGVLLQGAGMNGLAARGEDGALNRVVITGGLLQVSTLLGLGWMVRDLPPVCFAAATVSGQFLVWLWLERAAAGRGGAA